MNNTSVTKILLILSAAVFLFGIGFKAGEFKSSMQSYASYSSGLGPFTDSENSHEDVDLSLMWQVWDIMQNKYVDGSKIDKKTMLYGAMKGIAASVEDPYTFFLTPDENKRSKEDLNGSFEGIGAQLGLNEEGRVIIIAPLTDSPAEKAGAKAGDIITKVDELDIDGMNLVEVVKIIRGPKGTQVALTVIRDNSEQVIKITRDEIKVASVELSFEKGAAILKLNQFGGATNEEWDKAVSEIAEKYKRGEISGMVLDVRDNPGGFLEGAVYIASDFLPEKTLVVTQESAIADQSRTYYVTRKGKLPSIPLAVLINKGSASAAEIVSGALRDWDRAELIGEKSFGKGSVQEAIDLADNAGLHVTVAKWILPKGDWINKKGIEPDITIEMPQEEGKPTTDPQLEKAIKTIVQ